MFIPFNRNSICMSLCIINWPLPSASRSHHAFVSSTSLPHSPIYCRPQPLSSSTFFLIWRLWNCSTLVGSNQIWPLDPPLSKHPCNHSSQSLPLCCCGVHQCFVLGTLLFMLCTTPLRYRIDFPSVDHAPSLCSWHPTIHVLLPKLILILACALTECGKPNLSMDIIQPPRRNPSKTELINNRRIWPNQENFLTFSTPVQ